MGSVRVNITLPTQLLEQIDEAAREEHRSRSEFIRELARRHLAKSAWERYKPLVAERARQLGIETEADIERLIDEYRAERRGA